jgi:hypothetical protein
MAGPWGRLMFDGPGESSQPGKIKGDKMDEEEYQAKQKNAWSIAQETSFFIDSLPYGQWIEFQKGFMTCFIWHDFEFFSKAKYWKIKIDWFTFGFFIAYYSPWDYEFHRTKRSNGRRKGRCE